MESKLISILALLFVLILSSCGTEEIAPEPDPVDIYAPYIGEWKATRYVVDGVDSLNIAKGDNSRYTEVIMHLERPTPASARTFGVTKKSSEEDVFTQTLRFWEIDGNNLDIITMDGQQYRGYVITFIDANNLHLQHYTRTEKYIRVR